MSGPSTLPRPRGPLSEELVGVLRGAPRPLARPRVHGDPRIDDDLQLALHVAYELHYRSFAEVDEGWEWHPSLLAFTHELEVAFETAVRDDVEPLAADVDVVDELPRRIARHTSPSLSSYMSSCGTLRELREFAIHRSAYQLKEADPHTWAIPRLTGEVKATMVAIQSDEYGAGESAEMHSSLFADTMRELDLDPTYGRYLDHIPGSTLATGNLVTMFGLHRRLRGALVGHLAVFEMTSVVPMARYAQALQRLGMSSRARRFYDVHVTADAVHEQLALYRLAGALADQEPDLRPEILFGAQALMDVETRFAGRLLDSWACGASSLLGLAETGASEVLHDEREPLADSA